MSTVEKSIRLYAWKTNYQTFRIVQGEDDSRTIRIQLFNTTAPVNLSKCSVMLYAVKPDSTVVYENCEILDMTNGLVSVTLDEQIAAVGGTVDCWIQVIGEGGTDLRFEGMNIQVGECNMTRDIQSSSEFKAFLEQSAKVGELEQEVKAARMGRATLAEKEQAQDSAIGTTASSLRREFGEEDEDIRDEFRNADTVLQRNIDVEKARLDQLAASPEIGEGDLEKEMGDLRVGDDGVTYGSAGTMVRERMNVRNVKAEKLTDFPEVQLPIEEVKRAIEQKGAETLASIPEDYTELSKEVSHLTDILAWGIQPTYVDDKMIYHFSGYSGTLAGSSITDFIEIPKFVKTIIIRNCKGGASGGDNRGSAFYSDNSESSYISGVQMMADGKEDIILNVPSKAKYFRITFPTSYKDKIKFYFDISQTILTMMGDNSAAKKPLYTSLSVFENFGVIGDSFASGEIYVNGQGNDYYNLSWGQILARQYGVECKNFSAGGLTTRTWLTSEAGLPNLLGSNARKIYYLALGINDYYSLGSDYLGSISDIKEDFTQNADTFYGNYGKIIGNIKVHAPNAKIVMFTIATLDGVAPQFSEAIINIANHFGIPHIVQRDDEYFLSDFYTSFVKGHPVAITYSGMAQAFARLLDKCMIENYDYFKDYVG